jgi:MerR family copper efflux transcriptional regulator
MKIGELAKRAEVNVQTVRFYEREGLLAAPRRTASGYRDYEARDLERIKVIRVCQQIGFTLNDVREVLEPHRILASRSEAANLKPAARRKMLEAAERRLQLIEEKLALLKRMKAAMKALVSTLSGGETPVCPASARKPEIRRRVSAAA